MVSRNGFEFRGYHVAELPRALARVVIECVFTSGDISNEITCHRQRLVWNLTEKKVQNRGLGKYFRLIKTKKRKEIKPISLNFALICLFPCTTRN